MTIARVATHLAISRASVEAEFPDFLVVTAFSDFALADEEKAVAEVAVNQTYCQRLAKLLPVDAQALACHIARQTNKPIHQEQHAVQQSRGLAETVQKGARRYEPALG